MFPQTLILHQEFRTLRKPVSLPPYPAIRKNRTTLAYQPELQSQPRTGIISSGENGARKKRQGAIMRPKLNLFCHEILAYTESDKESVLSQINADAELPETVRDIVRFLIMNAPVLLSPSFPSNPQGYGPVRSQATQEVHR